MNRLRVEICLGSSCYARGNHEMLDSIEEMVRRLGLTEAVDIRGKLCDGNCAEGPCLTIGSERYRRVHPSAAEDLLRHGLAGEGA